MIRNPNFKMITSAARRLGTVANGRSAVQGLSTRLTCYRLTPAVTGGCMREVILRRNSGENEGIEKNDSDSEFQNYHFRGPPAQNRRERTLCRPGVIHTGHMLSIDACRDGRLNA